MFQRILVPLDGLTRAERALPMEAKVARASGDSVVLLRIIAPVPIAYNRYMRSLSIGGLYGPAIEMPPAVDQGHLDRLRDEVKRYVEVTATSSELQGITVETKVLFGVVASNILSATQSLHADLIVQCSRGYTGFKHWAAGSVAQQVARETPVPVLVPHEDGSMPTTLYWEGIPDASMRDDVSRETEATHERPGKTNGAQVGETEETAARVLSWVGLF